MCLNKSSHFSGDFEEFFLYKFFAKRSVAHLVVREAVLLPGHPVGQWQYTAHSLGTHIGTSLGSNRKSKINFPAS